MHPGTVGAMNLVIIESPYAGDIDLNTRYARACLRDSLERGEAPLASHLLYTQPGVLDDGDAKQRRNSMDAGWAWMREARIVAVYENLGVTPGMVEGIKRAVEYDLELEFRTIDGWLEKDAETRNQDVGG